MVKHAVEFNKLFLDELSDIYSAENQIVEALPNMISAASCKKLKDAFTHHLKETKNQVKRLERVFSLLNEEAEDISCEAMEGLIQEGAECVENYPPSAVRDAALIAAAQRIEHYEMAVYGTLRTFAKEMDLKEISKLLQESLDEEGAADKTLTGIAEGGLFSTGVNQKAIDS